MSIPTSITFGTPPKTSTPILCANAQIDKATGDTFADLQAAVDVIPKNGGSYNLDIILAAGTHQMGDDDLDLTGFYNMNIRLLAENELSAAGVGQTSEIVFNGTGRINISCSARVVRSSLKFTTVAGANQSVPISCYGDFTLVSKFNHDNHAASTIASSAFQSDGAKIISDEDTFSKGSADGHVMSVVAGKANGASLEIHDSEVSGTAFSYAAFGNCMADIGTTNAGYTSAVGGGAVNRTI